MLLVQGGNYKDTPNDYVQVDTPTRARHIR